MTESKALENWLEDQLSFVMADGFHNWLEEQGYEVFLRNPDSTEISIEVAKALFHSDRAIYTELKAEYEAEKRRSILRLENYPDNYGKYEALLGTLKNKAMVLPFVGAGLSVAAGCPTWSAYIIQQAVGAGFDENVIDARLAAGEQERVMDEVIARRTVDVFRRDFAFSFDGRRLRPDLSPARCFTGLFDGPAITTNFDRVLENCLSNCGRPFAEKVTGAEDSARFIRGAYSGERYLLKLHGNIDEPAHRVLTKQEYDRAYGENVLDYSKRLPKMMRQIFSSFSVIFLGCSLIADRYLNILQAMFAEQGDYMPRHFAILEAPGDEDELRQRDIFLAGCGVSPIWYSQGDYEAVTEILDLLKFERTV
jgi:hypothetical protein